jgi:hypothetical protein
MAIRVATEGRSDLRLAADVPKPNLTLGRTIAGEAGQVRGWIMGAFVRIPSTGFTDNAAYPLFGRDATGLGSFTASSDHCLRIGAESVGTAVLSGASALRPIFNARASTGNLKTGETTSHLTGMAQLTRDPNIFWVAFGVRNVGDAVTPDWRGFAIAAPVGGTLVAADHVSVWSTIDAGYLSGTVSQLLRQVFSAGGGLTFANHPRMTETGTVLEHFALAQGDFPWDTANDRPHLDAIGALCSASGASTLYDYAELEAAQLTSFGGGAALPFANCDDGLLEFTHWFTLENRTAGLVNVGSATGDNLTETLRNTGVGEINEAGAFGLADEVPIAPAHWASGPVAPTITPPPIKFFGGRGTRAISIAGTYDEAGGTVNVERRWETMGGTALTGFDWAGVTETAGAWSLTDTLPVGGPYRLRVRDADLTTLEAVALEDVLVGTVAVTNGQSGIELTFGEGGGVPGNNHLGLALDAGVQGMVLNLPNKQGGTTATYARPVATGLRMVGGETPAIRGGAITAMNQWHAINPGHPLCIVNMALSGTSMTDWAADATLESNGGHASWRYMGTIGAVADASSGNNSGIAETLAVAMGRWADVMVMMWHPGIDLDPVVQADYVADIEARWSANAAQRWLFLPPWRGDNAAEPKGENTRAGHVAMATALGARGWLGPHWGDIVMDSTNSLHAAYSATGLDVQPVQDNNQVGVTRIGRGIGRALAWVHDPTINVTWRIVGAWSDNARATVNVELGRPARTLEGAAVRADAFWVSTNAGTSWTRTGFTVALAANGTRVVLTPGDGGTAWAAAGADLRVDYIRRWIDTSDEQLPDNNEALQEGLLNGLLYDAGTWRGRTDLAVGVRPGNVLQGTGAGGLTVDTRGPARLLATERFAGTRPVTVRMMASDGVTVLAEKLLSVQAN